MYVVNAYKNLRVNKTAYIFISINNIFIIISFLKTTSLHTLNDNMTWSGPFWQYLEILQSHRLHYGLFFLCTVASYICLCKYDDVRWTSLRFLRQHGVQQQHMLTCLLYTVYTLKMPHTTHPCTLTFACAFAHTDIRRVLKPSGLRAKQTEKQPELSNGSCWNWNLSQQRRSLSLWDGQK